jgi:hypothetical protein
MFFSSIPGNAKVMSFMRKTMSNSQLHHIKHVQNRSISLLQVRMGLRNTKVFTCCFTCFSVAEDFITALFKYNGAASAPSLHVARAGSRSTFP